MKVSFPKQTWWYTYLIKNLMKKNIFQVKYELCVLTEDHEMQILHSVFKFTSFPEGQERDEC